MGLRGQLNDVSSDSIPLILLALIAASFAHLRSLLLSLAPSSSPQLQPPADGGIIESGLALLSEQLNLNRDLSFDYRASADGDVEATPATRYCGGGCVVCLYRLREGQRVRRLSCGHLFHKDCLDGWLHHMNFSCPLCRSPFVSGERVCGTRRRVGGVVIR